MFRGTPTPMDPMPAPRGRSALLASALVAAVGLPPPPAEAAGNPPLFLQRPADAAAFGVQCDAELANAQEALDRILKVKGARTVDNSSSPTTR